MPSEQKVTRKLRAILSADVKGCRILMADAEDVCVSSSTYNQINNKLELKCEYPGEPGSRTSKKPVRDYKI